MGLDGLVLMIGVRVLVGIPMVLAQSSGLVSAMVLALPASYVSALAAVELAVTMPTLMTLPLVLAHGTLVMILHLVLDEMMPVRIFLLLAILPWLTAHLVLFICMAMALLLVVSILVILVQMIRELLP